MPRSRTCPARCVFDNIGGAFEAPPGRCTARVRWKCEGVGLILRDLDR